MKILLSNYQQKKSIKSEPTRFPILSENLAEYRTGKKGFIDMKAAVSVLIPVAFQIATMHEQGHALPGLRADTVDIYDRNFVLNEKALSYEGVIFPGFSAPEIYSGISNGVTTDIYTFTALIYYLIIGQAPENAFNRMKQPDRAIIDDYLLNEIRDAQSIYVPELQIEENPFESESVKRSSINSTDNEVIDNNFIEILEKGLNLQPDERYNSMLEMIAVIEPYNTKASTIYPLLMDIDRDSIHSNLIVTKKTRNKHPQPEDILQTNLENEFISTVDISEEDHINDVVKNEMIEILDEISYEDRLENEEVIPEHDVEEKKDINETQMEYISVDTDINTVEEDSSTDYSEDNILDEEAVVEETVDKDDIKTEDELYEFKQEQELIDKEFLNGIIDAINGQSEVLQKESTSHLVSFGNESESILEGNDNQQEILSNIDVVDNDITKSLKDMWEMLEKL